MSTPADVPAGQYKGPIAYGPPSTVACGPCSLAVLMAWEKLPKAKAGPRPNIQGVHKRDLRKHLRHVHGVDLAGQPLARRERRQGCQHAFPKARQKCDRCGVTKRDIANRVKR